MNWLVEQFANNDVLSGVVGGSLFASILFMLKGLPKALWDLFYWRFTCSLLVLNEDSAFERVNEWLASLEYATTCRRLRLSSKYDEDRGENREIMAPGLGSHLIWYRGRPVLVEREFPEKGSGLGGWRRMEDIRIRTLGSSPTLLHDLVKEISEARSGARSKTTEVFMYRGRWRLACRKQKRALDTVTLPVEQKEAIVSDAERFIAARSWYGKRGVPYRRGYLLEGPAGTGKTTLALALAGHLGRPIYALNIGSLTNDNALIEGVSTVSEDGVLLIEDVDAAAVGARRSTSDGEKSERVTLSGLLNALDGVFSTDGRILIMTTNRPDKVDPALLRPGRADRREHIGLLDTGTARAMCQRFGIRADKDIYRLTADGNISPAELQERLLREREPERMAAE
jgi:mitochondrial chaperone BCS1